jgi:hypothetical protein
MISEQAIFLQDVSKLIQYSASIGFIVTGGELWRSPEQQEIYVKEGKSRTKNSRHLDRCAIDLNFFRMEEGKPVLIQDAKRLTDIVTFWVSLDPKKNDCGLIWGWDLNHFERKA